MTADRQRPSYNLTDLWTAIGNGSCVFARVAREGRAELGFTEEDGWECLKSLSRDAFEKSSPDKKGKRGLFHDVYKVTWDGRAVYVKFLRMQPGEPFVVTSFKPDTDNDI